MVKTNKRNTYYIRYIKEWQSVCSVRRALWVEYTEEGQREVEKEEALSRCLEERPSKQSSAHKGPQDPRSEQAWWVP